MLRLRRLEARDIVRVLAGFGFEVSSIRGRHAKLVRVRSTGRREILIVPLHRNLNPATVQAIFHQASRYVSEGELRSAFFVEEQ